MSVPPQLSAAASSLDRFRAHPRLTALLLGALAALTLPPFHLYPLLLAFAGLLDLLRRTERRTEAFVLGWCFGFAHFVVGLYWIGIAFFTDAERFGAFAVPAVLLLCAYLACYPALAGWLTVLHRWASPIASALVLAVAWTAGEAVRGTLFGGFPWNLTGYAFAQSSAISQLAALTGIYGLSLLAVALGALPVVWLDRSARARWQPLAAGATILAAIWVGGAIRLADAGAQPAAAVHLRLVQGNIPQAEKWQREGRARAFERHLTLSSERQGSVTHVVWPESAASYPLDHDAVARAMIAQVVPPGGYLLTGGERFDLSREPPLAWNTLFVLDDQGRHRRALRQARSGAVRGIPAAARPLEPHRPRKADPRQHRLPGGARPQHDHAARAAARQPLDLLRGHFFRRRASTRMPAPTGCSTSPMTPGSAAAPDRISIWRWRACGRSRKGCRWCAARTPASRRWSMPGGARGPTRARRDRRARRGFAAAPAGRHALRAQRPGARARAGRPPAPGCAPARSPSSPRLAEG